MEILALGHSSYLLQMDTGEGPPLRILADPWLTDYCVGDLLGRFPRLRMDPKDLLPLDAVYISHAHTDHLDPESLLWLWRGWPTPPTLLLPESLRYLEDVFRSYLDDVTLVFLQDRQPIEMRGAQIYGFFNPEVVPTNEDDVMVFVVSSEREVFLAEADALLPFYEPATRTMLADLFSGPTIETACFLTTKNEDSATMSMLSASDLNDRRERVDRCLESTYEEIHEIYAPLDDSEVDLWKNQRLVRLIGGQGICFPQALGTEWNRVLFPIRLVDRVGMEQETADQYECQHSIGEFVPGEVHRLGDGRLQGRDRAPYLELLDCESEREFDSTCALFGDFPSAPLVDEARDVDVQKVVILRALNERFLPHLIGARRPPIEHLLAVAGEYRIRVRYGGSSAFTERDYRVTFEELRFAEVTVCQELPHEAYWANDVDDFLAGRCDEFSTFCRLPLEAVAQRFWRTLGLPYLNNDITTKKLMLHFDRAARGEPLERWILRLHGHSKG